MPIAPGDLEPLFRRAFGDRRFVVVSNREPYEHGWADEVGEMKVGRPAGGLTSALDPLMQGLGGTWVAWGSGEADVAVSDRGGRVRVPPEDPRYTLRRVWLTGDDVHRYYLGFSNQFLWPLCHLRPDLARIRARYWERYRVVNRRFAEAVLDEVRGSEAVVWVQDYHLALLPGHLRARRPDVALSHFWHIPWPPFDIFRLSPQAEPLLRGLLANDLLGFHLPRFAENFLRCARRIAGAEVDWEARTATLDGHVCHVGSFPISIDDSQFRAAASAPGAEGKVEALRRRYAPKGGWLGVGVDRMDYSKGLPEKFKAIEMLLARYPEMRERFTFVQVAVPSRGEIEAYDALGESVERIAWEVNDRFGTDGWKPIHLLQQSLPAERLALLYRAADICIVSSLQDGMNLVAKEFVASQVDRRGVLLLSYFAGAAEEMDEASLINPYDSEAFAAAIRDALAQPAEAKREAMERLDHGMRSIYDWLGDVFQAWGRITADLPTLPPVERPAPAPAPPRDDASDPFA